MNRNSSQKMKCKWLRNISNDVWPLQSPVKCKFKVLLDASQNGFDKKKKMQINASVDVGKGNTCTLLVGVQAGAATVEIGVEVPHKIAN